MKFKNLFSLGKKIPSAVAVVGCHRSGTSMVTNLLARCGMNLGDPDHVLVQADRENPRGYWENSEVQAINEEIFQLTGGAWYRPADFPEDWKSRTEFRALAERAAELFARAGEGFLFKDPRTSINLPFWLSVNPGMKLVHVFREPYEVAASLAARDFSIKWPLGLYMWLEYNLGIIRHGAANIACLTLYRSYMQRPEEELSQIQEALGRVCPKNLSSIVREVVDPGLAKTPADVGNGGLLSLLGGLYDGLHTVYRRQFGQKAMDMAGLLRSIAQHREFDELSAKLYGESSKALALADDMTNRIYAGGWE